MFPRNLSRRVLTVALATLVAVPLASGPAAARMAFDDVEGSVHAPAVSALASREIVLGCDDDQFCPGDSLTRGQVASVLTRALDLDVPSGSTGRFSDTRGNVHEDAVAALSAAGITKGCGGGEFCPSHGITRGQLASMLTRALDVPSASDGPHFADATGTHGGAIDALAESGIAAGCDEIRFCGSNRLTRAQGATFIARGLDLVDRVRLAPYAERRAQHEAQSADSRGERAVAAAREQLGAPYRHGGTTPAGFDCSGLTGYAWRQAGVELPRTSRDQRAGTRSIARSDVQPGDLVFYGSPVSHVAMFIGSGRTIEAPNPRSAVRIANDGMSRSNIVGYGRPR